jgi:hypothetical protein
MLARLGHVIYWAACLISLPLAGLLLYSMAFAPLQWAHLFLFLITGGIWFAGFAARYVLAGPIGEKSAGRALLEGLAPIIVGAAALTFIRSALAGIGVSPGWDWLCAAPLGVIVGFLVMVWQVRDLIFVVPFRATTPGQAFWEAFYGAYAIEQARKLNASPRVPQKWEVDDPPPDWRHAQRSSSQRGSGPPPIPPDLWDTRSAEEEIERQDRAEREGRVRRPAED